MSYCTDCGHHSYMVPRCGCCRLREREGTAADHDRSFIPGLRVQTTPYLRGYERQKLAIVGRCIRTDVQAGFYADDTTPTRTTIADVIGLRPAIERPRVQMAAIPAYDVVRGCGDGRDG